jgi:predicted dithiol-disulfide oxidoreductase (DUF899 family)
VSVLWGAAGRRQRAERGKLARPGAALRETTEDPVASNAAMTGTDVPSWAMYPWLDRAPKGRNGLDLWWRRHDEYDKR